MNARRAVLAVALICSISPRPVVAQPQPFEPFNVNTRDGMKCSAVNDGGAALCVPGEAQGRLALKAFALWPTIPALKALATSAVKDSEAQRAATAAERAARLARETEGIALRGALAAEQKRAAALEQALSGSWWKTLLQYVVAPAGVFGLGFGLGRWLR